MFEKLIEAWADEQGFSTFAKDHGAVLRNLAKWLNQNAAQQPLALDVCQKCDGRGGGDPTSGEPDGVMECPECGTRK